jgi:hypothetical protein
MKNSFLEVLMILGASLCLAFAGCNRKPDAKTELEKAATELAKADPAPVAPAPVNQAPIPQAVPVAAPASPAPQQMNQAMAAYKEGKLEDAVTRLQKLRASPVMSPQQRMALNDAMAAVMSEIYTMAAKGDARAIAAVKQYEYLQSKP